MIDLKQKELKAWQDKNFPRSRYEQMSKDELIDMILVMQFTLGMAEEIGEISHHVLKGVQGVRGGVNGINTEQVGDGIGDTTVFGSQLCSVLKMDIEKEISQVTEDVLKRDWLVDPSGNNINKPLQNNPYKDKI